MQAMRAVPPRTRAVSPCVRYLYACATPMRAVPLCVRYPHASATTTRAVPPCLRYPHASATPMCAKEGVVAATSLVTLGVADTLTATCADTSTATCARSNGLAYAVLQPPCLQAKLRQIQIDLVRAGACDADEVKAGDSSITY
jgi:hypothetical protein